MKLVRIRPLNPKKGFNLKSYTYQGQRFLVETGWYEVSDDVAAYIAEVRSNNNDPDSAPAFDVARDDEDALDCEEHYKQEAIRAQRTEVERSAVRPSGLRVTTPKGSQRKPSAKAEAPSEVDDAQAEADAKQAAIDAADEADASTDNRARPGETAARLNRNRREAEARETITTAPDAGVLTTKDVPTAGPQASKVPAGIPGAPSGRGVRRTAATTLPCRPWRKSWWGSCRASPARTGARAPGEQPPTSRGG